MTPGAGTSSSEITLWELAIASLLVGHRNEIYPSCPSKIFLLSLMLLRWNRTHSSVCRLSLPSVRGVLSVLSTRQNSKFWQRTNSLQREMLDTDRCWRAKAGRRVPWQAMAACFSVPSSWPGTLPRPFGLLQKCWIFLTRSCRTGHVVCWDQLVVSHLAPEVSSSPLSADTCVFWGIKHFYAPEIWGWWEEEWVLLRGPGVKWCSAGPCCCWQMAVPCRCSCRAVMACAPWVAGNLLPCCELTLGTSGGGV